MDARTRQFWSDVRPVLRTAIVVAPMLAGCSRLASDTDAENVHSASMPIHGDGVVDEEDTPEGNAVVSYQGIYDDNTASGCSGILLTPQLVLTAVHCIWGFEGNDDCKTVPAPTMRIQIGPSVPDGNNPTYSAALIYLDEPVIQSTLDAKIARGDGGIRSVQVPRLATLAMNDPTPPVHGLTWGGSRDMKMAVSAE